MTLLQRVRHALGLHEKENFCVNVHADGAEGILTIGGWQCQCGKWKLTVFYHS